MPTEPAPEVWRTVPAGVVRFARLDMSERRKKSPRSPAGDEFLARVFAGVKPLEPRPRIVPKTPNRSPPALQRDPFPSATPARFRLEREGEALQGYRIELGPEALRDLQRSRWRPEHALDLHGRRAQGLERALASELRALARRGKRRLLLIHGKGLHSERGVAVLRDAAIDALTEGPAAVFVRAFCTAPLELGGAGALVVELEIPPGPAARKRVRGR